MVAHMRMSDLLDIVATVAEPAADALGFVFAITAAVAVAAAEAAVVAAV